MVLNMNEPTTIDFEHNGRRWMAEIFDGPAYREPRLHQLFTWNAGGWRARPCYALDDAFAEKLWDEYDEMIGTDIALRAESAAGIG